MQFEIPCKPCKNYGLQKNIQKISTHLLTVLIISAIVQLEQRKGTNKEIEFVLKHPGSRVTGK